MRARLCGCLIAGETRSPAPSAVAGETRPPSGGKVRAGRGAQSGPGPSRPGIGTRNPPGFGLGISDCCSALRSRVWPGFAAALCWGPTAHWVRGVRTHGSGSRAGWRPQLRGSPAAPALWSRMLVRALEAQKAGAGSGPSRCPKLSFASSFLHSSPLNCSAGVYFSLHELGKPGHHGRQSGRHPILR